MDKTGIDEGNILIDIDAYEVYCNIDTDRAYHRVKNVIWRKQRRWLKVIRNIAAALFIPLLGLCTYYISGQGNELESRIAICEMRTDPGMTGTIILSDGTKVTLNAGSVLRYPSEFTGGERKVELEGEGYFEVSKNKESSFILDLPQAGEITVYGTRFNVEAYADTDIVTTLVEGSIGYKKKVKRKDNAQTEYRLTPNQSLTHCVKDGTIKIKDISCEYAVAWKDNMLVLDNTPLPEILKLIGRKYSVKFIIENTELESQIFSGGRISYDGLENMLEMLRISSDIKWEYAGDVANKRDTIKIY